MKICINYIQNNQLEEFPNLINHIKSLAKGQHKARYIQILLVIFEWRNFYG